MPYKNKSDYNAWQAQFRKNNPEYCAEASRASIAKKPEHYRKKWRRNKDWLPDHHVRQNLSRNTGIKPAEWPDWIVELKRKAIQLKRTYGINQDHRRRTEQAN